MKEPRGTVAALGLLVVTALVGCLPSERSSTPPEQVVVERAAAVEPGVAPPALAVRPVRLTDDGLGGLVITWYHEDVDSFGFSTELRAELELTELEPVSAFSGAERPEDGAAYAVGGTLRHLGGAPRCDVPGMWCRVEIVEDADLVGLAVRRGTELTVDLQWRGFGPDNRPAQPLVQLVVGDRTIGYHGVAEALEQSGVVGRPFTIDISTAAERRFGIDPGAMAAGGAVTVTPARAGDR